MTERPGLLNSLAEWLSGHSGHIRVKSIQSELEIVCSKYKEPLSAHTTELDTEKRVRNVADLAARRALAEARLIDLQICLNLLIDESIFIQTPSIAKSILDETKARNSRPSANALFRCFLSTFIAGSDLTRDLATYLQKNNKLLGGRYQRICRETGILDQGFGLTSVVNLMKAASDLNEFIADLGLGGNLQATRYGQALRLNALQIAVHEAETEPLFLDSILNWLSDPTEKSAASVPEYYATALLPWEEKTPPPRTKKSITDFSIVLFGDPRIRSWPNLDGDSGGIRRARSIAVLKKWLALDSLDLFFKIIDATAADEMWPPRKKFWLPYFEAGVIGDVTLILASTAGEHARRIKRSSPELDALNWAKLTEPSSANQSVLLMKLDTLTIAEWSHSGMMRFWQDGKDNGPAFHRAGYTGPQLRGGSAKVRTARNGPLVDGIVHQPEPKGAWQRKAQYVINDLTGVRL